MHQELDYLERTGRPEDFGPLRQWGSIGYVLSSFGIGAVLLDRSLSTLPYVFSGVMAAAGILAFFLPAPQGGGVAFHWKDGLRLLSGSRSFTLLLLGMVLCGATLGISSQYLPIYMQQLGASGWMIGLSLAMQAGLEIPLMAAAPTILGRLGVPRALLIGIGVLPLRWLLNTLLPNPALLLPVQLLHGLTIAGLMVAGAVYVSRLLPERFRATGQSLFSTSYGGVGWSLGLLAAGPVYETWGMISVWIFSILVSFFGVLLVAWVLPRGRKAAD